MAYCRSAMPSTPVRERPLRMPPNGGQAMRLVEHDGPALGIQPAGEARVGRRPVEIVLHIVFARPGELHRHAGGLGDLDRLADVVGAAAPSESAAHVQRVDLAPLPA